MTQGLRQRPLESKLVCASGARACAPEVSWDADVHRGADAVREEMSWSKDPPL